MLHLILGSHRVYVTKYRNGREYFNPDYFDLNSYNHNLITYGILCEKGMYAKNQFSDTKIIKE